MIHWAEPDLFTLNGVRYRCMTGRHHPDEQVILKSRAMVDDYEALIGDLQPRRIMELGIYGGGSVAFFAHLAKPDRLVALDLASGCRALDQFITDHTLGDTVTAHYGVDQANPEQVNHLVGLFDGPLDLVIDDASHLEEQTRASFNLLFPHVRPGGVYVIEDWSWPHLGIPQTDPAYQQVAPLSSLVCALVIAAGCRPGAVAEVTVRRGMAVIRRGPADLNPGVFDLGNMVDDTGAAMVEALRGVRTR